MGEAVIVSAIEKLGNFLLRKTNLRDDKREKLRSLVVEKADMRSVVVTMAEVLEDNKEMLYRLLIRVADPFNLEEDEEEEIVMNLEKVSDLVFEMADLWEDDGRESIYKEKLHTLFLHMKLIGIDYWVEEEEEEAVCEKLYSLAIEMAEDGKGKLRKEKLYRWLAKKEDFWDQKRLGKGKLRKEKLYRWLARKVNLWDQKSLFDLLHHLTTHPHLEEEEQREFRMKDVLKKVEETKNDLMIILDINKSEDLPYFISDAVEMAHDASLLVAVMDSDPFIFFLEIVNCFFKQQYRVIARIYVLLLLFDLWYMIMIIVQGHPFTKFLEEIKSIQEWIQETKKRMVEFGSAESQINYVGEKLQLADVVGLDEDVELIIRLFENNNTYTRINGMVGIGKTTLARVLYNHPKIVDGFEGRAWVCFSSRKLSRKELLINLIRQLLHSKEFQKDDDDVDDMLMKLEEADNRSLRQMLHQQLRCKRYFIVLDDVSEDTYLKYFISKGCSSC